jgi:hypothetical protein
MRSTALVCVAVFAGLGCADARAAELLLIGGQGDDVGVTAAAIRTHALKTWAPGGLHMLSHRKIGDERNLGSRFQFGEFLGLGADLGEHRRYSLLEWQYRTSGRGPRNAARGAHV